ncbi:hypothetical protein [Streptomyces sp. NBC_00448]|uniref:hypothetical protein n=1 Tax=Streptomyces sp. NBC_00448 TaxID=2903652 RepID=UPI002E1A6C18
MTLRTRRFTAGAVGLVAIGALAAVLVHQLRGHNPQDAKPPPLGRHPADVQRLVAVPENIGILSTGGISLPHGRGVDFGISTNGSVKPLPGPHEAELGLYRDEFHADWHLVKAGDVITGYGVRVKVLKIWRMPNPDHDAMDIQADPLPAPPPAPVTPIIPIPSTPATASRPPD